MKKLSVILLLVGLTIALSAGEEKEDGVWLGGMLSEVEGGLQVT